MLNNNQAIRGFKNAQNRISKWLTVVVVIISIILLPISLIPAGLSFYIHETHGQGFAHEFYVWGTFFLLLLMPVVFALGMVIPWRAYKKSNHNLVRNWCILLILALTFWVPQVWVIY